MLRGLREAGVEFVVVGGEAAVLQGAMIFTQDLDIVHRRTPENVRACSRGSSRTTPTTGPTSPTGTSRRRKTASSATDTSTFSSTSESSTCSASSARERDTTRSCPTR